MPLQLAKVHHYVKQPGENVVKLVKTNPYMRFSREGCGIIFLQAGHFWYEGGELCPDRPAWLMEEIRKASPVALKEAGYDEARERAEQLEEQNSEVSQIRPPSKPIVTRRTTTVRRPTHGSVNRG